MRRDHLLKNEPEESHEFFHSVFFYQNRRAIYKHIIAPKLKQILKERDFKETRIKRKDLIRLMGQRLFIHNRIAKTILNDMVRKGYMEQDGQRIILIWW